MNDFETIELGVFHGINPEDSETCDSVMESITEAACDIDPEISAGISIGFEQGHASVVISVFRHSKPLPFIKKELANQCEEMYSSPFSDIAFRQA